MMKDCGSIPTELTIGLPRIPDRLYRLLHDPIVCSNNQDNDVGCQGTPRPHCRKGRVSRCVQECDCILVWKCHCKTSKGKNRWLWRNYHRYWIFKCHSIYSPQNAGWMCLRTWPSPCYISSRMGVCISRDPFRANKRMSNARADRTKQQTTWSCNIWSHDLLHNFPDAKEEGTKQCISEDYSY